MTRGATFAVVPVQHLDTAKSRLAHRLSPAERRRLVIAMLDHVLGVLRAATLIDTMLVVTPDDEIATRARAGGACVLAQEQAERGLNRAVRLAQDQAVRQGADALLVVLGDLPRLTSAEVDALVGLLPDPTGIVLAPDRHDRGTNALLLRPPGVIATGFGSDSLRWHRATADGHGVPRREYRSPGFAFDLDTVDDLRALDAIPSMISVRSTRYCGTSPRDERRSCHQ